MGVWNSHTSVGNILGSVIAGVFVNETWGLSFVIPGLIIASMGVIIFFFLTPSMFLVQCILNASWSTVFSLIEPPGA